MHDDPIREAWALLEQSHEIKRDIDTWRAARAERAQYEIAPPAPNPSHAKDLPPLITRARSAPLPPAPPFDRQALAEGIGAALGEMRQQLRRELLQLASDVQGMRDEIAVLKAELAVRGEIDELRRQISILRSDRVIDLPPLVSSRSRGGVA